MAEGTGQTGVRGVRAALLFALAVTQARAEEPVLPERPTQNLFGMTGLIDTPSAEMQPDGQLSFSTSYFGGYSRNTLSAQILPGVEAAFRYSILEDMSPGPESTLYDRSFDIKLRLIEESPIWPSLVLGLQDFFGTGVYSGEYFAGTKRFFDGDLKVTGGIGWGRFAGLNGVNNPFCQISNNFCDRDTGFGQGGSVNFGRFFSGEEMGFFGGVEWETPLDGLTLKAEYSNDDYRREQTFGDFDPKIPVNFGAEYRLLNGLDLGAYFMYGTTFGLRLSLSANPLDPLSPNDADPGPLPFSPRPVNARSEELGRISEMATGRVTTTIDAAPFTALTVETRDGVRWAEAELAPYSGDICPTETATAIDAEYGVVDVVTYKNGDGQKICTVALREPGRLAVERIRRDSTEFPTDWHADAGARDDVIERLKDALQTEQIRFNGIDLRPDRVTLYIDNRHYLQTPRAVGRTVRALARTMPPSVGHFEVVPVESGMAVVALSFDRTDLEMIVERPDAAQRAWQAATISDAPSPNWFALNGAIEQYPKFDWSIAPIIPVNLFDPDDPLRFDLQLEAGGRVEFLPGLSATGRITKRIVGQLDNITRESDSVLPRVRSDIALYLREGDPAITQLTGDYLFKLDGDIYARATVGLMERMFGGVGAEVLWKPANQSWGLGAEVNYVRQRDFDGLFSFQDYDVVTGHASLYWDTGFYGLTAEINAGRYLAGDYGGTIRLTRRFSNGWEIGAFATFTDVPFDEFGEGSFDRGLVFTIPFNWVLPYESRSRFETVLRPLTRDGGQRLEISNRLWPVVRDQGRGSLGAQWGGFWQ